jgi:VWFA-related protein
MIIQSKLFKTLAVLTLAGGLVLGIGLQGPSRARAGSQERTKPLVQDVTVSVKLIQAYVSTKDGKPVTDLEAADFEVTDNGQVVPVTHFEKHVVGGEIAAPATAKAPRLNRKFFLFFDFAFIDQRAALRAREAGLHFIDTELKPGDEVGLMSFSSSRGLTIHEYLSTDHAKIRRIVDGFGLRSTVGRAESLTNFIYADELKHMLDLDPTAASAQSVSTPASRDSFFEGQAQLQTGGRIDDGRRQSYIDQARWFAEMFGELARALRYVPGWKNIILFSGGIARNLIYGNRNIAVPTIDAGNPEATAESMRQYDDAQSDSGVRTVFTAALKDLKTANSPIYAIDCSRPQGEVDIDNPVAASMTSRDLLGKDSLVQLANETGGKYFSNSMDYRNALASIQDITSAFYVLGYSIPARWDGAFHKIKVKVKRPGCKVSSQNGYYNPRAFPTYSKFERLLQMVDLALSDNPQSQIPAEVPMAALPVMIRGWMHVAAFVRMPKEAAAAVIGDKAEAYLLLFDETQGKTSIKNFALKLPEAAKDTFFPVFFVPVGPGRYSCRMVVQNSNTGFGARGSASLVIPKSEATSLWLDPPLLLELNPRIADIGAAAEATLAKVYAYDSEFYGPRLGDLPEGVSKIHAALRCTLAAPGLELGLSASLENPATSTRTNVPVAILNQSQEGQLRTYLLELTPEALKAGSYVLKIIAAGKDGGPGAYSETTLTVK